MPDITELLPQMRDDDPGATSELIARLYNQLHRLVAAYMRRERGDHRLQTNACEAYLRFIGQCDIARRTQGVWSKTVNCDWLVARAWLHGEIAGRQ